MFHQISQAKFIQDILVFQVYEAVIEDKGKNFIFMRLSKTCVEELGLSCDQDFYAQVTALNNQVSIVMK